MAGPDAGLTLWPWPPPGRDVELGTGYKGDGHQGTPSGHFESCTMYVSYLYNLSSNYSKNDTRCYYEEDLMLSSPKTIPKLNIKRERETQRGRGCWAPFSIRGRHCLGPCQQRDGTMTSTRTPDENRVVSLLHSEQCRQ